MCKIYYLYEGIWYLLATDSDKAKQHRLQYIHQYQISNIDINRSKCFEISSTVYPPLPALVSTQNSRRLLTFSLQALPVLDISALPTTATHHTNENISKMAPTKINTITTLNINNNAGMVKHTVKKGRRDL